MYYLYVDAFNGKLKLVNDHEEEYFYTWVGEEQVSLEDNDGVLYERTCYCAPEDEVPDIVKTYLGVVIDKDKNIEQLMKRRLHFFEKMIAELKESPNE